MTREFAIELHWNEFVFIAESLDKIFHANPLYIYGQFTSRSLFGQSLLSQSKEADKAINVYFDTLKLV